MNNESYLKFYPGLDGVRALAIILVIIFHWVPARVGSSHLPLGPIGVTIFFVLSGFLISGILFQTAQKSTKSIAHKFYIFMMRRVLRIFPVYYLILVILLVLKHKNIQIDTDLYQHPIYYFTFSFNFLLENTKNWSDFLSPYWSVSVEEQFYLMWAPLVFFVRKKTSLKLFFIATIFLGLLVRVYYLRDINNEGVLTLSCIDCFAWGGLYALLKTESINERVVIAFRYLSAGSILLFLFLFYGHLTESWIYKVLFRTLVSIVSLQLIILCTSTKGNFINSLFNISWLRFIGKISYSLYLFHMVVPMIILKIITHKGYDIGINQTNMRFYNLVFVFVASIASWYLIEKPILRLKKHFNY